MGYEECQKCFSILERYRMRTCNHCLKDNWYCNACFKKYDICCEYKTVKKKYCDKCLNCDKCLKEYKKELDNLEERKNKDDSSE